MSKLTKINKSEFVSFFLSFFFYVKVYVFLYSNLKIDNINIDS